MFQVITIHGFEGEPTLYRVVYVSKISKVLYDVCNSKTQAAADTVVELLNAGDCYHWSEL